MYSKSLHIQRPHKGISKRGRIRMQIIPLFLLTPNNFAHKAGDGTKTRKKEIRLIHPALQATPGGTQMTYLLEKWEKVSNIENMSEKIVCERRMDEGLRVFKGDTIGGYPYNKFGGQTSDRSR